MQNFYGAAMTWAGNSTALKSHVAFILKNLFEQCDSLQKLWNEAMTVQSWRTRD